MKSKFIYGTDEANTTDLIHVDSVNYVNIKIWRQTSGNPQPMFQVCFGKTNDIRLYTHVVVNGVMIKSTEHDALSKLYLAFEGETDKGKDGK